MNPVGGAPSSKLVNLVHKPNQVEGYGIRTWLSFPETLLTG